MTPFYFILAIRIFEVTFLCSFSKSNGRGGYDQSFELLPWKKISSSSRLVSVWLAVCCDITSR